MYASTYVFVTTKRMRERDDRNWGVLGVFVCSSVYMNARLLACARSWTYVFVSVLFRCCFSLFAFFCFFVLFCRVCFGGGESVCVW